MSSAYKVHEDQLPHFVTSTVVGWVDALSREQYKEVICDSLAYCQKEKGLQLHAWVLMSNHFHLIISADAGVQISGLMRDIKKFTSKKLTDTIANNPQESRKEWMMSMFRLAGQARKSNDEYQFWQSDYHPIALDTQKKMRQRLNYLHQNPVRAGIVWQAEYYKYSSAIDYYTGEQGLLPVVMLEC